MVYWVTISLGGKTPLQLQQPPCMIFQGSRAHEACFSLTIYFMPCLHYLLASFSLISLTLTVDAGNLVALWRKLHCGDKNTFSFNRNNLSLSTEINPVRQKMWKRDGGKIRPFVHSLTSFHFLSLVSWQTMLCCPLHQQGMWLFYSERGICDPSYYQWYSVSLSTSVFICRSAFSVHKPPIHKGGFPLLSLPGSKNWDISKNVLLRFFCRLLL